MDLRRHPEEELRRRFRQRKGDGRLASFAVRFLHDGELAGRVSYFDLNARNRSVEIGYIVGPPHRGRGVGREAVRLMLRLLFGRLGFRKATAQTGAFNVASIALLRGLGFELDGRLREHHLVGDRYHDDLLFSLLAREWREAALAAERGLAGEAESGG